MTREALDTPVRDIIAQSRRAPPPGTKWTPKSLRSGGITAAHSIWFPPAVIAHISNHDSVEILHRHYLDALQPSSAAARVFFRRFLRLQLSDDAS